MRTFRILVGASFLFFCTTLMHAGHMGMQDPQCSNGTLGCRRSGWELVQFFGQCQRHEHESEFANASVLCASSTHRVSTWNNILGRLDPSDSGTPILASDVFCDSQTKRLGTAFTCQVNSDANGDCNQYRSSMRGPGNRDSIPNSNLLIDLNPCGVRGEVCKGNGHAGNEAWPANFALHACLRSGANLDRAAWNRVAGDLP